MPNQPEIRRPCTYLRNKAHLVTPAEGVFPTL
jgi:hypothetical protein